MLPVMSPAPMSYLGFDGSTIQTIGVQEAYREIRIISHRTVA